jgi:hypothetical protein
MKYRAWFWAVLLLLWAQFVSAGAQESPLVCANGEGDFSARYATGVTVTVGAAKEHGLAERSCEATLVSGQNRVVVGEGAAQVDVDVMGVNLGLGGPVVAIQFRKSELENRTTYAIYSLKKTPQLIRTLTGSAFFSAADYKLNGQIDIRTVDAGAVDGFEGIPLGSFDFVPPIFLRFVNHKLVDVSAEYEKDYDQRIAELKVGLDRTALAEFRQSDGMLASGFRMPTDTFHALMMVKIRVLEIVWAYLYSGRDDEAWRALGEMWPAPDVDRIRVAMLDARKRGVRAQVNEVSFIGPQHKIKELRIFMQADAPEGNRGIPNLPGSGNSNSLTEAMNSGGTDRSATDRINHVDSNPAAIYMHEVCAPGECAMTSGEEVPLDLVVDDAGKVRSAQLREAKLKGPAADALLKSVLRWKFIPAMRMGQPVACGIHLTAWLYR